MDEYPTDTSASRGWGVDAKGRSAWKRGPLIALLAVLIAFLMVFHSLVPNAGARLGSLLETFLPWLGAAVPVLLVAALWRRSGLALLGLWLPVVAWLSLFGWLALPGQDAEHDIVAVQHNVSDENTDPAGTAQSLMDADPDLIALEELVPQALPVYEAALARNYPFHVVVGTVGLWSKYPLSDAAPVDIKPEAIRGDWSRGLRATAVIPNFDPVAVYVAHLPSLRMNLTDGFDSANRDAAAILLAEAIAAEPLKDLILLGDLNSTVNDRGLDPVVSQMEPMGPGFAFSWPANVPLARIDQIMARSADVTYIWSLPSTGSDHLAVAAHIRL